MWIVDTLEGRWAIESIDLNFSHLWLEHSPPPPCGVEGARLLAVIGLMWDDADEHQLFCFAICECINKSIGVSLQIGELFFIPSWNVF